MGRSSHNNSVCIEYNFSQFPREKNIEEFFSEEKPEVSHLKIFGCPVYIHIPKDKSLKLDLSGKKESFVGYSEKSKSYRIYIP